MESDNISEFKKLIKEVGIRKAIEKMKEKGIVYDEDFTESHKTDPIFSSPLTASNSTSIEKIVAVDIAYIQRQIDGNLYSITHVRPNEELKKLPFSNSPLNLIQVVLVDDDFVPADSGSLTSISSSELTITR